MTLAAFADVAEVIGALGVVAGLFFVGVQLRQNTKQMQRGEANMAMSQGSALRHLLLNNRETATLVFSGMSGAPLDPVDEVRLNVFFSEITYLAVHIWDRERSGLAPKDELARVILVFATPMLSVRGQAWWARMRGTFVPEFTADFEALVPALRPQPAPAASPSATAPQPAQTAVAPTADAG